MAFSADQLLEKVNTYLATMPYVREPKGLYAPIEYVLSLGGKRIRPVLMLLSYQLYKENVDDILPQAAGIETYHNYTLLHDDLMDCADMRRNKPTVHKVWDENTAILSGDAMLVLAYRLMNNCPERYLKQVMDIFSQTALEICEGQQWDMEFETRNDVTVPEYMEMIRLKTSVLLSAALKIGAVLGAAIATIIGQIVSFLILLFFFIRHDSVLKINLKLFKFDWNIIKQIYAVGIPSALMISISSILTIALNSVLVKFSNTAVSIYGIYYRLQTFITMPVNGLVQGVRPIIGFNYGAKDRGRIFETLKISLIVSGKHK